MKVLSARLVFKNDVKLTPNDLSPGRLLIRLPVLNSKNQKINSRFRRDLSIHSS